MRTRLLAGLFMLALPIWFSASGINKLATPKVSIRYGHDCRAIGKAAAHLVMWSRLRAWLSRRVFAPTD